jgi:hypothetical protein
VKKIIVLFVLLCFVFFPCAETQKPYLIDFNDDYQKANFVGGCISTFFLGWSIFLTVVEITDTEGRMVIERLPGLVLLNFSFISLSFVFFGIAFGEGVSK